VQILKQREFVAIPVVAVIVGSLFALFAAADIGLWAWLLVGVVGLVLIALLGWWVAKRHRHPAARDAPRASHPATDKSVHHVLVIADDVCTPEALTATIGEHAAGRPTKAFVVAPALGSRLDRWTGDQRGYDEAAEHLEATLSALAEIGVDAHGRIGAKDPIQAADDGLREFPADQIVLAVHAENARRWLEGDVIDAARERYEIPVTPIDVEPS
jgi:hypothetical protein